MEKSSLPTAREKARRKQWNEEQVGVVEIGICVSFLSLAIETHGWKGRERERERERKKEGAVGLVTGQSLEMQ